MKTKHILTAIAISISSIVLAADGNDPQVNVNNYKHANKAAKAQSIIDAKNGMQVTQVVKETENEANYKNSFKKSTYRYVQTEANKEVYPSNAKPQARNYKNQFQYRSN